MRALSTLCTMLFGCNCCAGLLHCVVTHLTAMFRFFLLSQVTVLCLLEKHRDGSVIGVQCYCVNQCLPWQHNIVSIALLAVFLRGCCCCCFLSSRMQMTIRIKRWSKFLRIELRTISCTKILHSAQHLPVTGALLGGESFVAAVH